MKNQLSRYNKSRKRSELKRFQQPAHLESIFIDAEHYPHFFNDNLVDKNRRIKVFYDETHCHERIFYFQLLKLIFQSDQADVDYQIYLNKWFDILDNPEFEFHNAPANSDWHVNMSDKKMKQCIHQFLDLLNNGEYEVEEILQKYPIMDKILVAFLRTMLIIGEKTEQFDEIIDSEEIYQFLSNYFQIEITYYQNCLRFNQVDVFVYSDRSDQVYLAYIKSVYEEEEQATTDHFYIKDVHDTFNLSSVKQLVSEIQIPNQQKQCFDLSKNSSANITEEVEYNYSRSQEQPYRMKNMLGADKMVNGNKNEQSSLQSFKNLKSNKILQKQIVDRRNSINSQFKTIQKDIYDIMEAPIEYENASPSSVSTPHNRIVSFGQDHEQFGKENIYWPVKNESNIEYSPPLYKNEREYQEKAYVWADNRNTAQSTDAFKRSVNQLLSKQNKLLTLRSLYETKSIKSINSSQPNMSLLSHDYNFPNSRNSSKKMIGENILPSTFRKFVGPPIGPININVSQQFTSSFILKKIDQPYQSNIASMKMRARKQRDNINRLFY